jgi:hypothetical protein
LKDLFPAVSDLVETAAFLVLAAAPPAIFEDSDFETAGAGVAAFSAAGFLEATAGLEAAVFLADLVVLAAAGIVVVILTISIPLFLSQNLS